MLLQSGPVVLEHPSPHLAEGTFWQAVHVHTCARTASFGV